MTDRVTELEQEVAKLKERLRLLTTTPTPTSTNNITARFTAVYSTDPQRCPTCRRWYL